MREHKEKNQHDKNCLSIFKMKQKNRFEKMRRLVTSLVLLAAPIDLTQII